MTMHASDGSLMGLTSSKDCACHSLFFFGSKNLRWYLEHYGLSIGIATSISYIDSGIDGLVQTFQVRNPKIRVFGFRNTF